MSTTALHISLAAAPIATFGSVVITNAMLTSVIASVVIVGTLAWAARYVALRPKSLLGVALENGAGMLLSMIEQVTLDRQKAERFFPLLATIFIFVLVNNWLGLLPGVGPITIAKEAGSVPLLRAATADLNTTFALAIISGVAAQWLAVRELGMGKHLRKYFSWNPVLLFVGLLEIVSELSRIISFSFRLFGNIFAGEVLLVVISFLSPLVAPLPFFGLELFVGVVQALIFTMLTLVFLHIATSDHADHEETHAPAPSGEAVTPAQAQPLPVHS